MTSMLWWVGGYQDLAHGLSVDWEVNFPINPSSRASYINQNGTRKKKLLNLILLKDSLWNKSGTNCTLYLYASGQYYWITACLSLPK